MNRSDILIGLCEQACRDEEWFAALKLISLLITYLGHGHPTEDGETEDNCSGPGEQSNSASVAPINGEKSKKIKDLIIHVLFNVNDDRDFDFVDETCEILDQIHKMYIKDSSVSVSVSNLYYNSEIYTSALRVLQDSLVAGNFQDAYALETFENMCCGIIHRWHYAMLNDMSRNKAYDNAICEVMSKNSQGSILDLGSGTGFLSFLAAKWSNEIYAVEESSVMCNIAKDSIYAYDYKYPESKISERISIVNEMSTDLKLPGDIEKRVDVLVTEVFDAGLFGEGILLSLIHAWKNLLKTDSSDGKKGTVIPFGATLYVEGIESQDIRRESFLYGWKYKVSTGNLCISSNVGMINSDPYTSVHLDCLPSGYKTLISSKKFLSVNFNDPQSLIEMNKKFVDAITLDVTREGSLDALCVWFKLHLTDSIEISTKPGSAGCWEQAIFPVTSVRLMQMPVSLDESSSQGLRVCIGDKVNVFTGLDRERLSLHVSSIIRPSETPLPISKPARFPDPLELLKSPVCWCPFYVHCLTDWEIRALNNTAYQESLQEALKLYETSLLWNLKTSEFLHINDGFSPLCLQALSNGFHDVQVVTLQLFHKALLWKLVQINKLDVQRIKTLNDPEDLAEENSESLVRHFASVTRRDKLMVVFDVIDHTGRLVEGWTSKLRHIKNYSRNFESAHILPEKVDIWGVIIESGYLLSKNRVVNDDNVLHFPVKDYINQYATKNHPDFCMSTLSHTKLTSPFRIFTLNLMEELTKCQQKVKEDDLDMNNKDSCDNNVNDGKADTQRGDFFNYDTVSLKIPTVAEGRTDFLMYWFDLHLSPCNRVNTSDPDHHWHQAAVTVDSKRRTKVGEKLQLKFFLNRSTIYVSFVD